MLALLTFGQSVRRLVVDMRIAGETVGARGMALLSVAAVAGLVLGVHGWSGRGHGLPPGGLGGPGGAATASTAPSSTPPASPPSSSPAAPPSQSASGSAAPTQGPAAPHTPTPGPSLSAQSYAAASFQVWPGPVNQAGQAALTGLSVKVTKHGSGITVVAGVLGQPPSAPAVYPTGVKVWVVETSMGDDSGNSDYSLGDDGLIVTDAQGRVLQ